MTSTRRNLLALVKLADLSVVAASLLAIIVLADRSTSVDHWLQVLQVRVQLGNFLFVAVYLGVWHIVLRGSGLYNSYRLAGARQELRDIGMVVMIAVAPLAAAGAVLDFEFLTPGSLVLFGAAAYAGLVAERRALRRFARRLRRHGRNLRSAIVIGAGEEGLELAARLARREELGYRIAAVIETDQAGKAANGNGNGGGSVPGMVEALIEQRPVDEVFIALPLDTAHELIRAVLYMCEEQGITVRLLPHISSLFLAQARPSEFEGRAMLTIARGPSEHWALLFKRAFDFAVALVALALLTPFFLLVAVLIKLDSPGPALFVQERVGLNRRRFRAYKFRTMVKGADRMQAALEAMNEADGPVFKIERDPRATRLGRWLRKTSIDELPQLINVLKGEMSLVGPRPLPLRDVGRIDTRWHKRRFSVKPGITCLWQVQSRQPRFDEWIRLDMEYIDNWSVGLDLKILAKTIPAVLSGQGAN